MLLLMELLLASREVLCEPLFGSCGQAVERGRRWRQVEVPGGLQGRTSDAALLHPWFPLFLCQPLSSSPHPSL